MLGRRITTTVLTLAPLAIGLSFALDMYIAAVPEVTRLFHSTEFYLELTLNLFMFSAGISQFIIGPASDRYGRRKSVLFCILFYIISALLCALSNNIVELILARILQGISSCGMLIIAFAIVRDVFSGIDSAKTYSYVNGITAFSPAFAPMIGAYIDIYYGWEAVFYVLAILGVIIFISTFTFVNETLPKSKRKKLSSELFKNYRIILSSRNFLIYALVATVGLAYIYTFFAISPFILITTLHVPEQIFGYLFAFMGVSWIIGSIISGQIVGHIGVFKTVCVGSAVAALGGACMIIWNVFFHVSVWSFIIPMLPLAIGGTMAMGSAVSGAIEPFADMAGTASATMGGMQYILASIISTIISIKKIDTPLPLGICAFVFSTILLIFCFRYKRELSTTISRS